MFIDILQNRHIICLLQFHFTLKLEFYLTQEELVADCKPFSVKQLTV